MTLHELSKGVSKAVFCWMLFIAAFSTDLLLEFLLSLGRLLLESAHCS